MLCRSVCTTARFVTKTSWSKNGNISTRWSSMKQRLPQNKMKIICSKSRCCRQQESPAVADKPARRKTMPKIAINSTCLHVQRCCWQYWSIFIRLAVGPSEICEILWKFKLIQFKVIHLGANRKRKCTFLLATNSNFGRTSYRFWDIDVFSSKIASFSHTSLIWRPLAAERNKIST